MPDLGTDVYNAVAASLPDCAVTITVTDGTVFNAVCDGIGQTRTNSEQGQSYDPIATLYIPAAADVDAKLWFGGIVKVLYRGRESDCRIETVHNQAGLLRIDLKALNG